MSISSAFSNAFSGLTASSRRAELVSNNIANAMTEGYARREVNLSSVVLEGATGGVRVGSVQRAENVAATSTRRIGSAEIAHHQTKSEALAEIVSALGEPGTSGALGQQYVEFGAALLSATNDPANTTALNNVVSRAKDIATSLNQLSVKNDRIREAADAAINLDVQTLNTALTEVRDLNLEIRRISSGNGEISSLIDKREKLIDQINEIVPVNVVKRDKNQVALFSPNGGVLLDGQPALIGFAPTNTITQNMTLVGGALSPLTVNGRIVSLNAAPAFYDGGSLAASFEVRDASAPAIGDRIDALARDLVERFQTPAVDPTLTATDPGLFTDGGALFNAVNQQGLAGRISVNAIVDPVAGGASWRLRDGFNSVTQGPIGNNTVLMSKLNAFDALNAAPPGLGINASMSASDFANQLTSELRAQRVTADDEQAYLSNKLTSLKEVESNLTGVDVDEQVQRLLEIEKAYAANARVMNVLDELLDRLMEI